MNQVTSDPSVSFFEMPVPLKFKNASQEKTIVVDHTVNGEFFTRYIGFKPDTVLVDPEYWLISKNNTTAKTTFVNTGNPSVEVYPNPMQYPVTVFLQNFSRGNADMALYNDAGQLIHKQNIILVNGGEIIQLNVRNLSRGVYILKITAGDFTYTKKLLR